MYNEASKEQITKYLGKLYSLIKILNEMKEVGDEKELTNFSLNIRGLCCGGEAGKERKT